MTDTLYTEATWRRLSATSRLQVVGLALAVSLIGLMLWGSAPALALSQRGHEFKLPFGSSGEAGKTLSRPGDVAVSASTGDVYVLDRGNNRIVQYAPEVSGGKIAGYKFVSAWGWGVKSGGAGTEYERCFASEACQSGIAGRGEYQFNAYAFGIAIDNCTVECSKDPSAGDIYVLKETASKTEEKELIKSEEGTGEHAYSEYATIVKLSPDGEKLERTEKHTFDYEGGCTKSAKRAYCSAELENGGEDAQGITLGPDGTVWLDETEELFPLGDTSLSGVGEPAESHKPLVPTLEGEATLGLLAEDARNHFYIGHQLAGPTGLVSVISAWEVIKNEAGEEQLEELGDGEHPLEALDFEQTTGVATNQLDVAANEVNEENDVYITNVKTEEGTKSSSVAQFAPSGGLIQRFSATAGMKKAQASRSTPRPAPFTPRMRPRTASNVFTLEEPRAPSVDGTGADDVTGESAELEAQVDPGGAETHYTFRYAPGAVPVASEECRRSSCVETPQGEEAIVKSWGDKDVSAYLQAGTSAPLQPGTVYHYRVIARNRYGVGEREGSFRTSPSTTPADEADGRIWEMVSPAAKEWRGRGVDQRRNPARRTHTGGAGRGCDHLHDSLCRSAKREGSRSYEGAQMLATRGLGWVVLAGHRHPERATEPAPAFIWRPSTSSSPKTCRCRS